VRWDGERVIEEQQRPANPTTPPPPRHGSIATCAPRATLGDQGSIASTTHDEGNDHEKDHAPNRCPCNDRFLGMAGVTPIASATDKTTRGKIAQILVHNIGPNCSTDGCLSFTLEGGPRLCEFASGDGTTWVVITTNYASAEAIRNYLSIVTAAKLAGREVEVRAINSKETNEWGCRADGVDLF
jgi:hypothetical protein